MLEYLPESVLGYAELVMAVVAIASVAAAGLAKLTKTDKDDKIAGYLVKLHDFLAHLGFHPPLEVKKAGVAAVAVVDHRTKK